VGEATKKRKASITPLKAKKTKIEVFEEDPDAPVVLITFLPDKLDDLSYMVRKLGGKITENPRECTHLVADHVRRTTKFLSALSLGRPILISAWIEKSAAANRFLDEEAFYLRDEQQESKFQFNLRESQKTATQSKLFANYHVFITKTLAQLNDLIPAAGGPLEKEGPQAKNADWIIISCEADREICEPWIALGYKIYNSEFLLCGILRQKLDFENCQEILFAAP